MWCEFWRESAAEPRKGRARPTKLVPISQRLWPASFLRWLQGRIIVWSRRAHTNADITSARDEQTARGLRGRASAQRAQPIRTGPSVGRCADKCDFGSRPASQRRPGRLRSTSDDRRPRRTLIGLLRARPHPPLSRAARVAATALLVKRTPGTPATTHGHRSQSGSCQS